jgi:hypothetical protein
MKRTRALSKGVVPADLIDTATAAKLLAFKRTDSVVRWAEREGIQPYQRGRTGRYLWSKSLLISRIRKRENTA